MSMYQYKIDKQKILKDTIFQKRFKMKELFASMLIAIVFTLMVISCAEHEDQLVNKHCGHLTGYEYGA